MTVKFEHMGLAPDYVDYERALNRQVELLNEVAALKTQNTVLLLEHQPVFTAGKLTEDHEYPTDKSIPVIKTDRGGKLTWHGPGQLTGYPILRLPLPFDVVKYVRILEEIIINVVASYGIKGDRVEGRSGVWVLGDGISQDKKIAAIGIRVSKRTTMHGFALNCSNDTNPFGQFIPCGISDAGVTTISEQVGYTVTPADVIDRVEAEIEKYANQLALDFAPGDSPQQHGFTR